MVRPILICSVLFLMLCIYASDAQKVLKFYKGLKKKILKEHNKLRSKFAKGKFTDGQGNKFPKAKDMIRLVWNKKMAKTAEKAAKACKMGPPINNNLGESQFTAFSNSTIADPENLALDAVKAWLKEFDQGWNPNLLTKSEIGHAIQAVWGRTRKIGCAIVSCDGGKGVMVVCEYAPKGNMANKKAYKPGKTCQACPKRFKCNKKKGLCG